MSGIADNAVSDDTLLYGDHLVADSRSIPKVQSSS